MHIVFFISDITSGGGTERISLLVANYLVNMNYQVSFITLKQDKEETKFYKDSRIAVHKLRKGRGSPVTDVALLRQMIGKLKPDIFIDVDTVLTPVSFLSLLLKRNITHIAWEHFNYTINLGIRRRDIGRVIASKFCDKSIVLTEADKQYWVKHLGAQNIEVMYNPVTIERASEPVKKNNEKVVMAVGRLAEQKGFDLLLKAWSLIDTNIRNQAKLRIFGDGPDKDKLIDFIESNDLSTTVELVGYSNNIQDEYQKAYLYVLSSRFEGFVLSLTEAMATGLPVVSYDCPCGPRELIGEDSGILVEAENTKALANAIATVIADEDYRDQLAENGFSRSKQFTQEDILPKWDKLLQELHG